MTPTPHPWADKAVYQEVSLAARLPPITDTCHQEEDKEEEEEQCRRQRPLWPSCR